MLIRNWEKIELKIAEIFFVVQYLASQMSVLTKFILPSSTHAPSPGKVYFPALALVISLVELSRQLS